MSSYRLVRVLIHPGKSQTSVSVIARTVSGRSQVDRIVHRGVLDPVDVSSVEQLLRAAAASILGAADRL